MTENNKKKKKPKNYVNNRDFFDAICKYQDDCKAAREAGHVDPVIPNYIGHCFVEIANRLSSKFNFRNYSYRDEFVADGIENSVVAIHSFNREKTQNPFAYFTQIIYYAFLRRIEKEKKHSYIKHKALENFYMEAMLDPAGGLDLSDRTKVDVDSVQSLTDKFEGTK